MPLETTATSPPGLTYQGKPRTCGFRLSFTDVVVLVAAVGIGAIAFKLTFGYSLFVPFVVLHFFLFCNVFRIRRNAELVWAALFVLNCLAWVATGNLNIGGMFGSQMLFTVLIIGYELRAPTYHGVFARVINAKIDDYLAGRT